MEAYFYCKYGGIKPICSDCKRNHLNSEYKTSDIETWFTPTYIKTNGKSCTDYTPNKKRVIMEFNSQICTNKEQSERLLALGLKKETADCVIMYYDGWHIGVSEDFDFDKDPVEPAWSLHRLIEILDIWYLDLDFHNFANAYEQVISYFEERVKGGFIKKEYLEEL